MKFKDLRVNRRIREDLFFSNAGIGFGIFIFCFPMFVGLFKFTKLAWISLFFAIAFYVTGEVLRRYEVKI